MLTSHGKVSTHFTIARGVSEEHVCTFTDLRVQQVQLFALLELPWLTIFFFISDELSSGVNFSPLIARRFSSRLRHEFITFLIVALHTSLLSPSFYGFFGIKTVLPVVPPFPFVTTNLIVLPPSLMRHLGLPLLLAAKLPHSFGIQAAPLVYVLSPPASNASPRLIEVQYPLPLLLCQLPFSMVTMSLSAGGRGCKVYPKDFWLWASACLWLFCDIFDKFYKGFNENGFKVPVSGEACLLLLGTLQEQKVYVLTLLYFSIFVQAE